MYRILRTDRLAATIARFVVEAPLVARKRRAGQFVIVRVAEAGERIPLTIVDADPVRGTITLVVQAVGKTTKLLLTKRAGDTLVDVLGPLGNPTPVERYGEVVCVGGGVGASTGGRDETTLSDADVRSRCRLALAVASGFRRRPGEDREAARGGAGRELVPSPLLYVPRQERRG